MPSSTTHPALPSSDNNAINWGQLHGCSQELLLAHAAKEFDGLLVVITADMNSAYKIEEGIRFFSDSEQIHIFPDWETLPYDVFSPLEDIVSDRLKTLSVLAKTKRGILIVSAPTVMHRLAPTDFVNANTLTLNIGDTLDTELLREELERSGYRHVSQVLEHGEYTTRGSLIDLFPMGSSQPFRIDLFDDEIETIRSFDPETQRSLEKINHIELLPAHEFPFTKEGILTFKQNYRTQIEGDLTQSIIYSNISEGTAPAGIEYYLPLFFETTATLFDYLPKNTLIIQSEEVKEAAEHFIASVEDRHEQRSYNIERPILPPEHLFLTTDELTQHIDQYKTITTHIFKQEKNCNNYHVSPLPSLLIQPRAEAPLFLLKTFLDSHPGKTLFIAESAGRREELISLLRGNHYSPVTVETWQDFLSNDNPLCITVAPLIDGLWLHDEHIAIIPEALLIGQQVQQQRRRRKPTRDADAIVRNLTDLSEGAPVVHEEHGVGRYLGMET
ncbi:MAG: transcription-repair coupling factor, partial [Thiotrichaceae bacterium]